MEALGSLLAIAALIVVVAYIVQPFLAPRREEALAGQGAVVLRQRAALLAERNALYESIRELDFDHQTGKVADQDYAEQRYKLVAQGVDLLQRLDVLPPADAHDPLEGLILSMREGEPLTPPEVVPPLSETEPEPAPIFCPQCGQPARPGDRFCANCGAALA